jgi:pimeloyl-ACP methyl ester carboxylesterase
MNKAVRKEKSTSQNIKEIPVAFGDHDIKLKGKVFFPAAADESNPVPGMLLCHGFGSAQRAMEPSARIMAEQGVATMVFDFRGHGTSEGAVDGRMADDVVDAWDVLNGFPQIDKNRMGLVGHSLGAMSAILAAGQIHDVKALVALSCPPHIDGWMSEEIPDNFGRWGRDTNGIMEYPRQGAFPWLKGMAALISRIWMYVFRYRVRVDIRKFFEAVSKVDMIEVLGRLDGCSKLFVFCEGDTVTPYSKSVAVYQGACEPKSELLVDGGYHTAPLMSGYLRSQWIKWAVETVKGYTFQPHSIQ